MCNYSDYVCVTVCGRKGEGRKGEGKMMKVVHIEVKNILAFQQTLIIKLILRGRARGGGS